jgi:Divergent InlB B-repeat domain/Immunoglobulin I-set domain/Bacterial TSP3 repeat
VPNYSYDASGNVTVRAVRALVTPQIVGQPVQQVAEPGNIVTFSVVVADASATTFQWKFNGTNIPAATGDSLLLTNVNTANEGQYSVVVTNSAASVTSAPAALMLDSDGDGLPDAWEKANFTDPDPTHPLNPANQRSETDPDKDDISNLDEFLDGTDPNDKGSFRPRLTAYSGAGGSVTVTPMKLSYDLGESVTLTPLPFPPSVFIGWVGDLSGTDNPATLTMDRNKTLRARFASAVPLPPGLIALWRGEADASDLIGGHHGTFFAGTTVTTPRVTPSGKVGGAFDCDGTVHVQVPDSAALSPAQLTAEAWVFPTAHGVSHTIIARGSSTSDYGYVVSGPVLRRQSRVCFARKSSAAGSGDST